jgi:hypothetical protein
MSIVEKLSQIAPILNSGGVAEDVWAEIGWVAAPIVVVGGVALAVTEIKKFLDERKMGFVDDVAPEKNLNLDEYGIASDVEIMDFEGLGKKKKPIEVIEELENFRF